MTQRLPATIFAIATAMTSHTAIANDEMKSKIAELAEAREQQYQRIGVLCEKVKAQLLPMFRSFDIETDLSATLQEESSIGVNIKCQIDVSGDFSGVSISAHDLTDRNGDPRSDQQVLNNTAWQIVKDLPRGDLRTMQPFAPVKP